MDSSDLIALAAFVVSLGVAIFTIYQHHSAKKAKLELKMSIGRSYSTNANGIVVAEYEPTTRLIVRNLSSRPSAIIEIRVKNPAGSILSATDKPPGGDVPIKLEPWDVKIITSTWPAGEHTEGMYFSVTDIDDKEYQVYDYTNNKRRLVGENVFHEFKQR